MHSDYKGLGNLVPWVLLVCMLVLFIGSLWPVHVGCWVVGLRLVQVKSPQ